MKKIILSIALAVFLGSNVLSFAQEKPAKEGNKKVQNEKRIKSNKDIKHGMKKDTTVNKDKGLHKGEVKGKKKGQKE